MCILPTPTIQIATDLPQKALESLAIPFSSSNSVNIPSPSYNSTTENLNQSIVGEELEKLFLNGRIQGGIAIRVKKVALEQVMDHNVGVHRNCIQVILIYSCYFCFGASLGNLTYKSIR